MSAPAFRGRIAVFSECGREFPGSDAAAASFRGFPIGFPECGLKHG
jgi:hypothetical protein